MSHQNVNGQRQPATESKKDMNLFGFLYNELTRNYWLENDRAKFTERRKRVYSFFKIPRELEKFILYGFFQCLDAFLFIFTLLPLRFLKSLLKLVLRTCFLAKSHTNQPTLDPAEICDLLKVVVLVTCCFLMNYIDVSMMYHVIRGQTVIKLYIFFNMLDVADKLCSSFGQDILDSLFWTATEKKGRRRDRVGVMFHLVFAIVYVLIHTILVLMQANTLNVAFNSHNKALLTIMMSNNFVELKASVFKKFEKSNLFQMSCSDVRERFHLTILLFIVAIRNLAQFSWSLEHFWVLLPDMILVMLCELLVDWVKHAFITKFNDISYDVYREYNVSIAYDIIGSRHPDAFSDHVDMISRRMGFIPLPLAAVIIRVVLHSIQLTSSIDYLLLFVFYLCLLTLKILNSIVLLGIAQTYIKDNKQLLLLASQQGIQSNDAVVETWKSPSKDDLDLPAKAIIPDEDMPDSSSLFRRSQSLIEFVEEHETSTNSTSIPMDDSILENKCLRKYSLTSPDNILYNSTVSLQSVTENETMENDLESFENQNLINKTNNASNNNAGVENISNDSLLEPGDSLSPRRRKNTMSRKSESSDQPLSEVDRYTMCSNRIVQ